MGRIFVTSDTHLCHAKIIEYCSRPFSTSEEMDETIVRNWNSVVSEGDKVYHLGDVYMGDSKRADWLLSRLNGSKRLILGNHDDANDGILHRHFKRILMWRFFKEEGLLLTHVPIHPLSLQDKHRLCVHGHVHNNVPEGHFGPRYRNVSVEVTDYRPVPMEDLAAIASRDTQNKTGSRATGAIVSSMRQSVK